jgi:hypothetical protein
MHPVTHMHTRLYSKYEHVYVCVRVEDVVKWGRHAVEAAAGFGACTRGAGEGRGWLGEGWGEEEPSAAGRGDPRGSSWHRAHHTSLYRERERKRQTDRQTYRQTYRQTGEHILNEDMLSTASARAARRNRQTLSVKKRDRDLSSRAILLNESRIDSFFCACVRVCVRERVPVCVRASLSLSLSRSLSLLLLPCLWGTLS